MLVIYLKGLDSLIWTSFTLSFFSVTCPRGLPRAGCKSVHHRGPAGSFTGTRHRPSEDSRHLLGWAQVSQTEENLFPCSDWKQCCWILVYCHYSVMGFHWSFALPSILVCYHLSQIFALLHLSSHWPALEDWEVLSKTLKGAPCTGCRNVGPLVAQNLVWN